jgi:hypothetical protein
MNLLPKTLGLVLAVAATFTGCAAAATLAFGSTALSAGNAGVSSCGVSSLSATRNVDNAGKVTRVDVGAIPLACSGETLSVTLVGASSASLGSGTGVVGGCATTCSVSITASATNFGVAVSAANVLSLSFAVVGA